LVQRRHFIYSGYFCPANFTFFHIEIAVLVFHIVPNFQVFFIILFLSYNFNPRYAR
jgi:hypothetical protein